MQTVTVYGMRMMENAV